jgi:hypothetical protein
MSSIILTWFGSKRIKETFCIFFRNKETTAATDYQVFIVLDILLFYNEMLNLLLQLFQQLTASSQFFQSNFLKNKNLKNLFDFLVFDIF